MKKILIALFVVFGFTVSASAQVVKAQQTVKISLPTVQCEMCKNKIETYLKRYDGIMMVNVNYKRKEATVKYLVDRISEEDIKAAISNAGYDANEVTANPESYQKLPKCCKKPEDGGGKAKMN
jgi:periplasmic mercuric ion binding protein